MDLTCDARAVVRLAADRPGAVRVVGVDGRSGSGKTTFAALVAGLVDAPVLHLDDVYPGWDGLGAAQPVVAAVLAQLVRGRPGSYRSWDWTHERPGELVVVPATPWLVVEGVGCGAAAVRRHLSVLVWLDAPDDVRRARALARDGETFAPHWQRWAAQEDAYVAQEGPASAADVVLRTQAPPTTRRSTTARRAAPRAKGPA